MIDLTDGLASDVLQICKSSKCGARIYLERIPFAKQTSALAEEMNHDPVVAALNGGEDYELLFTADAAHVESLREALLCETGTEISVIGHITAEEELVWMENGEPTELNLNGFTHF
jgi:thiamine-monophosphate kinase